MATAQANAAERLDQLLVDVGAGPMVGELVGGDSRFVSSTSGHIGAIVNPSSNPKAGYRVGDEKLAHAGQRIRTSGTEQGSWWDDHVGTTGLAPLADAPGTYVFES